MDEEVLFDRNGVVAMGSEAHVYALQATYLESISKYGR